MSAVISVSRIPGFTTMPEHARKNLVLHERRFAHQGDFTPELLMALIRSTKSEASTNLAWPASSFSMRRTKSVRHVAAGERADRAIAAPLELARDDLALIAVT